MDSMLENSDITILVVDDDTVTRKTLEKVLTKSGYQVMQAVNGKQALDVFTEHRADMVLLDVMMPEMDGYSTCQELRKIAGTESLPILMLTGLDDIHSIDKAFNSGATDFVTKPISWPLLGQRVRYALRTQSMYEQMLKNQLQLSQAQKIAGLGYFEINNEGNIYNCSEDIENIICVEFPGGDDFSVFASLIHPDDSHRFLKTIRKVKRDRIACDIDYRIKCHDGNERILHHHSEPLLDEEGTMTCIANTIMDITKQKNAEAIIEYQNNFDSATNLHNRQHFIGKIEEIISTGSKDSLSAVIFLSVDRFKSFTDALGHVLGDKLLKTVSDRLSYYLPHGLKPARFSDDTLSLVMENVSHIDEISALAQKLLDITTDTYHINSEELFTTSSIGISIFPLESDSAESLLKGADKALSEAKKNGGNQYHFYSSDMNRQSQVRIDLESGLRKALDNNELALFYQPQINTHSGEIVGMEALIRWIHPEKGIIPPLDFISVAEESGMILPIGQWVLETACKQTKKWHDAGFQLRVGVNLSARQFTQDGLLASVDNALASTGLAPESLELEITESTIMHNFNSAIDILKKFREKGIKISIDDFGTGYSSLSYIHRLPINTLKIDRAFIKDIDANGKNGEIAGAVIAMSHSMGLSVIAEGVETTDHIEFLQQHQCDELQGYFYSKPLPASEFEDFLKNHSSQQKKSA